MWKNRCYFAGPDTIKRFSEPKVPPIVLPPPNLDTVCDGTVEQEMEFRDESRSPWALTHQVSIEELEEVKSKFESLVDTMRELLEAMILHATLTK